MADLPVTIIGGYLGAGKTTLVNALLRQAQGIRRLAILVNDFGDIAIDADLIETSDANMLQLAGGCVCCTIGNDMVNTLVTLQESMGDFDHVVVETSGVALPGVVASTIQISTGVRPDGVVVLADALNIRDQLSDKYIADTIERQLSAAQLLVLTKTDRIADETVTELRQSLSEQVPNAQLVIADNGKIPLDIALDLFDEPATAITPRKRSFTPGENPANLYVSASWTAPGPTTVEEIRKLLSDPENQVLRAKGFITDKSGNRLIIHAVAGEVSITESTPDTTSGRNSLVVIGLASKVRLNTIDKFLVATGWNNTAN